MRETLLYSPKNNTDKKHDCAVHRPLLIPPNISPPGGLPVQIDMICHKYIGPNPTEKACILFFCLALYPFMCVAHELPTLFWFSS